jgi:hypothetical protein
MSMTMDNLFMALPRDLQWEILSEFVGTHVVRNGKLRRKLTLDITHDQYKYSIRYRPSYDWLYNHGNDEENDTIFRDWFNSSFNDYDHMRICSHFAGSNQIMFCKDMDTDEPIYMYRIQGQNPSVWDFKWKAQFAPINPSDSIVLPPFKKNTYLSYAFTNKKLGRK